MKNAPVRQCNESAPSKANFNPIESYVPKKLSPRYSRFIKSLLTKKKMTVKDIVRACGCNNGPDLVLNVRKKLGIEIPCPMISGVDRDGNAVSFGRYEYTDIDRRIVLDWLKKHDNND